MTPAPGFEVDWNLVRTFISVVSAGSLAGAARALDLSHPTVARHVQLLEEQLGVSLFERSGNGLSLNEAGEQLAEVAERMRRDAMTLETVGEQVRLTPSGRVRVTVAELFAGLVPDLLQPLQGLPEADQRHIELIVSPAQLNLLDREADIAVRHIRPEQTELVCRRVGSMAMGAWASSDYLDRYGEPSFESLDAHCFVDGLTRQPFSAAVERLGYRIPLERVAFLTDSLQCQLRAAELGWGIVGIPEYLGDHSTQLQPVLRETDAAVSLEVWVVARPAVRQQHLLKTVFDALAEGLADRFGESRSQLSPRKVVVKDASVTTSLSA